MPAAIPSPPCSPRSPSAACLQAALLGLLGLLGAGCGDPSFSETSGDDTEAGSSTGHDQLDDLLVLSTTDFSSGAIGSLRMTDLDFAEHALGSSDARVQILDDRVYVLHRYMFDYLDVFEPARGWARVTQIPLDRPGVVSTNPQAMVRGADDLLYMTTYGAPDLLVVDPDAPPLDAVVDGISLADFADADGITEAGDIVRHTGGLAVFAQRLDQGATFARVDEDVLIFVDELQRRVIDIDPAEPGVQGMTLWGTWPRQVRPRKATEDRVVVLSTGLLEVDLVARSQRWLVPPERFTALGLGEDPQQPQAFDLDAAGDRAFVAAYRPNFSQVDIFGFDLEDPDSGTRIVEGLNSVERSLEVIGDTLWFGDTTIGAEGLRAYDLDGTPRGPRIPTGLAPYSLAARGD